MTNPEARCASTTLAIPNYRAEAEAEENRMASLITRGQRDNAVKLLRYAADELALGRFLNPAAALEFVIDEIL